MVDQLELFRQRLPAKPYCSDDLPSGLQVRPQRTAAKKRYIQANPPWLRSWLIFDVDRPGAALAWDDCHLPEPIWTSMNRENGHAHLCWGLDAPVLLGHHDREKPMRYLAAVETAMRVQLEADPGYSGLVTKNPANPHWHTLWARSGGLYDLSDLSEWLELPRYVDRRHKPEQIGLGRNVTVFDWLRHYAYRAVKGWKRTGGQGIYVRWHNHLYDMALQRNGDFPQPMDPKECYHIATSVAHWVWTKFDIETSDKRFSALQSHRGSKGGRPATTTANGKPWEAEGVSRATWYRRLRQNP